MPSAWLYPGNRFPPGQRAPRRPSNITGHVNCEAGAPVRRRLPKAGGDAEQPLGCAPRPAAPGLPHPPGCPRPALLPGFSPASAEEVAEDSVRTLGSLCERPRDTRHPLPSSDAAMGPAGAAAS